MLDETPTVDAQVSAAIEQACSAPHARAERAREALRRVDQLEEQVEAGERAKGMLRQAWYEYAAPLVEQRAVMPSTKAFGEWVKANKLDTGRAASKAVRSDAMWMVEHWAELQRCNSIKAHHPTRVRQEFRERGEAGGKLAREFGVAPFSVLNARSGAWQERKRLWRAVGLRGGEGRAVEDPTTCVETPWMKRGPDGAGSEFDPALAEWLINSFSAPGAVVLDPFAGGATRGIVAGRQGCHYYGVDIYPQQIEANRRQAQAHELQPDLMPQWVCGDSHELLADAPECDLILTSPPFFDLEKYGADPRDLANMKWPQFRRAYREIIASACSKLRDNRFAAIVVGDVRDERGFLRRLPDLTADAFEACDVRLYNDFVLEQPCGSAPLRASQFAVSRKAVRVHQSVLVFVKGDPGKAAQYSGERRDEDKTRH